MKKLFKKSNKSNINTECINVFSPKTNRTNKTSAFTIVELLIVIVIIGILATITIVSYTGITKKANEANLQSDLTNASKKLEIYKTQYNSYPTELNPDTGCPTQPKSDTDTCLKFTNGTNYEYKSIGINNYNLTATKSNMTYYTRPSSSPTLATTSTSATQKSTCPTGYIQVPGSTTYNTKDFCVMKYEAKNDGSNNAVSIATGTPWVSITQTDAIAKGTAACTGCHLITEAQWMTLAQNVLSVPSNWSGNAVGNGYIYSGHNDNAPANSLAATTNDADGYNGTGQTSPSNQKRTLTLTNGEVIWDMAGNVHEWTDSHISGFNSQPGLIGESTYTWKDNWNALTAPGNLPISVTPTGTGLIGANAWTTTNGVGGLWSNAGETTLLRGLLRGGAWGDGGNAGVLAMTLIYSPSDSYTSIGFRIAVEVPSN